MYQIRAIETGELFLTYETPKRVYDTKEEAELDRQRYPEDPTIWEVVPYYAEKDRAARDAKGRL